MKEIVSEKQGIQHLILPDSDIIYYSDFLSHELASEYFSKLKNETAWQQDSIKVFGKIYKQPRLTALFGTEGKSYCYSGITMFPKPFNTILEEIKTKVELISEATFNTVLLNLYRDGNDSNGWHSDDEKELGKNPCIASVSLGAPRFFHLKHRTNTSHRYKVLLAHGSLLLMRGKTQECWKHQIPKTKKSISPRINLTFRKID